MTELSKNEKAVAALGVITGVPLMFVTSWALIPLAIPVIILAEKKGTEIVRKTAEDNRIAFQKFLITWVSNNFGVPAMMFAIGTSIAMISLFLPRVNCLALQDSLSDNSCSFFANRLALGGLMTAASGLVLGGSRVYRGNYN